MDNDREKHVQGKDTIRQWMSNREGMEPPVLLLRILLRRRHGRLQRRYDLNDKTEKRSLAIATFIVSAMARSPN